MVSDDLFELKELPRRLAVVGSGYIGLEFACIFHGLGVRGGHRLPQRAAAARLRRRHPRRARRRRWRRRASASTRRASSRGWTARTGTAWLMTLDNGARIETDAVLLATGRAPNVHGLGLDAVGVECTAKGAIEVDEDHRTTVPQHLRHRRRDRQAEPDADGDRRRPRAGRHAVRQEPAPGELPERAHRGLHLAAHRHGRHDGGRRGGAAARWTSTSPASRPCATASAGARGGRR